MNVLLTTLQEEYKTAQRLETKYRKKLAALPQGSFVVRQVDKRQYGYLTYLQDGKVRQKYLGAGW